MRRDDINVSLRHSSIRHNLLHLAKRKVRHGAIIVRAARARDATGDPSRYARLNKRTNWIWRRYNSHRNARGASEYGDDTWWDKHAYLRWFAIWKRKVVPTCRLDNGERDRSAPGNPVEIVETYQRNTSLRDKLCIFFTPLANDSNLRRSRNFYLTLFNCARASVLSRARLNGI